MAATAPVVPAVVPLPDATISGIPGGDLRYADRVRRAVILQTGCLRNILSALT
jgi:hypothetical protein